MMRVTLNRLVNYLVTIAILLNDTREFNKAQMFIKQGFLSRYFLIIGVGLLYIADNYS
ncbi:MAG: hypothetical protein RLZZ184_4354 [Cyanobacteriota bacterium]|jgi:hypothetical protein